MDDYPFVDRVRQYEYSEGVSGTTRFEPSQEDHAPMKSTQTLQLLYVKRKLQTFCFPPGSTFRDYSIKVNNGTGFLNKPDLLISHGDVSEKISEGRFEKYDTGTTINYLKSKEIHDLRLESSLSQRFIITLDGKPLWWWQPSQQEKDIYQVLTAANELVAQFTYSSEHTLVGSEMKDGILVGALEVGEAYVSEQAVLDQLVSITVILVERSKRRGRKLQGFESAKPMNSLALDGGYYGGTVG